MKKGIQIPNNLNEWNALFSFIFNESHFSANVTLKSFSNLVYGYARILKPYQRWTPSIKLRKKIKDT